MQYSNYSGQPHWFGWQTKAEKAELNTEAMSLLCCFSPALLVCRQWMAETWTGRLCIIWHVGITTFPESRRTSKTAEVGLPPRCFAYALIAWPSPAVPFRHKFVNGWFMLLVAACYSFNGFFINSDSPKAASDWGLVFHFLSQTRGKSQRLF